VVIDSDVIFAVWIESRTFVCALEVRLHVWFLVSVCRHIRLRHPQAQTACLIDSMSKAGAKSA
jgi:hypothetical protein